jgi:hypothetical protein
MYNTHIRPGKLEENTKEASIQHDTNITEVTFSE